MDKYEVMRWISKFCESIAAIACLLILPRWRKTYWKWLSVYVLFVAVSEWIGYYLRLHPLSFLLNPDYYSFIVHPGIFFFIFFIIKKNDSGRNNRLFQGVAFIYILSCIVDYLFLRKQSFWFMSFSYMVAIVLLITLLLRFYYEYFFSDKILSYKNNISFWMCTSWFIYYCGTFPFFALRNTLAKNYESVFDVYWFIQMITSCLMYVSIIFIYKWAKQK